MRNRDQLVFIPFAFYMFGFLTSDAVELLSRVQRIMHINVIFSRSMDVVFKRIDFTTEKGLAAQLVARCFLILYGKLLSSKQVLEAADEKNKSMTYTPLEGDAMLQIYKSLKAHIHFSENGENNFVTWTLEYEKINEDVPDPDALIDLAYKVTKVVELHLLK
ncbi:kirola [Lactuca sativa]|uniref:kirola n=1 Tax=Lactuca sativa TaxID=4236 RepID=UPI000CD8C6C4|nr:kirola [Lactuca sativa]